MSVRECARVRVCVCVPACVLGTESFCASKPGRPNLKHYTEKSRPCNNLHAVMKFSVNKRGFLYEKKKHVQEKGIPSERTVNSP